MAPYLNSPPRRSEGEGSEEAALALLEARRPFFVRRARPERLLRLLCAGTASADDFAGRVGAPRKGIDPRFRGTVPGPLSKAGIIGDAVRVVKSARSETHAFKVRLWKRDDRPTALAWPAHQRELPDTVPALVTDTLNLSLIYKYDSPTVMTRRAAHDHRRNLP